MKLHAFWDSNGFMKSKALITLALLGAAISLCIMEFGRGSKSFFAGFDRRMQTRYEQIPLGWRKNDVLEKLGPPHTKSPIFCLPQKHGFERFFEAAEKSDSMEYLLWVNGMNWFYCMGFNALGNVVVKGEGHS